MANHRTEIYHENMCWLLLRVGF